MQTAQDGDYAARKEFAAGPGCGMTTSRHDLVRTILGVLAILALILAIVWVLRPFIGPAVWAATIVVATWPLMLRLQGLLGGRRLPAVALMTLGMLALLVVPLVLGVVTVAHYADDIVAFGGQMAEFRPPPPPAWVAGLPIVGAKLHASWAGAAAGDTAGLIARLAPYTGPALSWLVDEVETIGLLLVQAAVVVVLATVMYSSGERTAAGLGAAARRLAGEQGAAALRLAGLSVRSVALGVGITAVAQAALGGIGLAVAGVPYAAPLTVLMFVLAIAQIGPLPVLLPAAGWMYWSGEPGWAVLLVVVSVLSSVLDTVLRPLLIRLGADLHLLLVFAGVVGGMLAFGLVGIFIGPVVLAVGYTLAAAWVRGDVQRTEPAAEALVGAPPP
jgi:predicted PurR-regulated permease PerM